LELEVTRIRRFLRAATSAAFMIPLFGVGWGALLLREPVTWGMLPGCVLVLAATALITGFNPFRAAAGR
jgi:drug/metabolite transporter (DMT)-like permease